MSFQSSDSLWLFSGGLPRLLHVAVFRDGTGFDRGDQVIGLPFPPVPFVLCLQQGLLALFAVGFGLLFRDVSGCMRDRCTPPPISAPRPMSMAAATAIIFISVPPFSLFSVSVLSCGNGESYWCSTGKTFSCGNGGLSNCCGGMPFVCWPAFPLTVRFVVRLAPEVISRLECLRWVIIRARASGGWGRCLGSPSGGFGWVILKGRTDPQSPCPSGIFRQCPVLLGNCLPVGRTNCHTVLLFRCPFDFA